VNPESVWSDPEIRDLQTDPRKFELGLQNCATPFRLGTADNLLSALEHARKSSIPGLAVPFFVSHGAQDTGVLIEGTEDFLMTKSNVPDEDKKYVRKDDAKHDLLAEPCREDVVAQMCEWMNSRLDKPYTPQAS
jgi:alpha-beta hydrolase superfamily lysophospholipase